MTIDQIKCEIQNLTAKQRSELAAWLHEFEDDEWDKQMAADAEAGKLDPMIEQAKADRKAGRVREWP